MCLDAFRGRLQRGMLRGICATRAVPVLGYREPQRVGAQMGYLAEEVHGRFGISIFQLAVRRAHAAQRLNLAAVANVGTRLLLRADFLQSAFPAFAEAAFANVV